MNEAQLKEALRQISAVRNSLEVKLKSLQVKEKKLLEREESLKSKQIAMESAFNELRRLKNKMV